MARIYTRTGDAGTTSLVGGKRVNKACDRLESYGTIDELNAQIGLLLTYVPDTTEKDCLVGIQNRLFVVGAQLATEPESSHVLTRTITDEDIAALERDIDQTAEGLPKWKGFTLPGGCRAAAHAHVCRTVCRRAERCIERLNASEPVESHVLAYINRLSDYFYVLALRLNVLQETEEILWKM